MTKDEIAKKSESLRVEALRIPEPTMGNYKRVLASYKSILNEVLVCIRDLARS